MATPKSMLLYSSVISRKRCLHQQQQKRHYWKLQQKQQQHQQQQYPPQQLKLDFKNQPKRLVRDLATVGNAITSSSHRKIHVPLLLYNPWSTAPNEARLFSSLTCYCCPNDRKESVTNLWLKSSHVWSVSPPTHLTAVTTIKGPSTLLFSTTTAGTTENSAPIFMENLDKPDNMNEDEKEQVPYFDESWSTSSNSSGSSSSESPSSSFSSTTSTTSASSDASTTTTTKKLPVKIPIKHSTRQLPRTCMDRTELNELTQQILEAPVGSLFSYNHVNESNSKTKIRHTPMKDRVTAWQDSFETVQLAEYVMRGHSFQIPGTIWNRWNLTKLKQTQHRSSTKDGSFLVPPADRADVDVEHTIETMHDIMERLYDEGCNYMRMRSVILEDLLGLEITGSDSDDQEMLNFAMSQTDHSNDNYDEDNHDEDKLIDELTDLFEEYTNNQTLQEQDTDSSSDDNMHDTKNEELSKSFQNLAKQGLIDKEDIKEVEREKELSPFMDDFAWPGPTVAMFDTILDSIAVTAGPSSSKTSRAEEAAYYLTVAMARHSHDHKISNNIHTVPTILTFNAAARAASKQIINEHDPRHRDNAMSLALMVYNLLAESETNGGVVQLNAATYLYLLRTLNNVLPGPSIIKCDILHGIYVSAKERGLLNDTFVQEFLTYAQQQNPPPEIQSYKTIQDLLKTPISAKFKRNSKRLRYHPREDIY